MSAIEERRITWKSFLEEVLEPAREAHEDPSPEGIENYLGILAAGASRLDPTRIEAPEAFHAYPGYPEDNGFALFHRGAPFIAVQWRLEPHATMPFHPHASGSVCTLLLEGAARVRNFQFVDEPDWDAKGKILLQHTREDLLRPGSINLIGNPHDNIHGFRAGPEGARGIDITTPHRSGEARKDSLFEIEEVPVDPVRGLYKAVWRNKGS